MSLACFILEASSSSRSLHLRYRENAENADVPLTPGKEGSEEIPQNEYAEDADTKTQKMQKMRMIGFNVDTPNLSVMASRSSLS